MQEARAVWDGLILERSLIGCLLRLAGSDCVDHQTRERFDYELFVVVVQFLPQARLRNRDIEEVQIQLRHGSPAVEQIAAPMLWRVAKEHLPGNGAEASPPSNRQDGYRASEMETGRRHIFSAPEHP